MKISCVYISYALYIDNMEHIFVEITLLFAIASFLGLLSLRLKQPLMIFLIFTGILSGPSFLNIIQPSEYLHSMSQIGISILLFLVGLKLDINMIKHVGKVALATGLGQVIFTSLFGFLLSYFLLGIDPVSSLYIAIALTFSSTIIIVKLLSDKHELNALYGRIALGFLIVQDIFVILSMVLFSVIGNQALDGNTKGLYEVSIGILMILSFVYLFIRYISERITTYVAKSPELLLFFSVFLATTLSLLTYELGLGMELGGLLAGVCVASTSSRDFIASKMASVRDFLLFFFFIVLGLHFQLNDMQGYLLEAIVLSLFIIIGNPLIVIIIMNLLGYKKRTGFKAGLTVAQISEFSLIFIEMGSNLGYVNPNIVNMITLVGIITITSCAYCISYSDYIYSKIENILSIFEFRKVKKYKEDAVKHRDKKYDIILFGLGSYGRMIINELKDKNLKILGIDFDPDEVKKIHKKGCDAVIADLSDVEFLESIPLLDSKVCICVTTPAYEGALLTTDPRGVLLKFLKHKGYKGKVVIRAKNTDEVELLDEIGAHVILDPFTQSAKSLKKSISKHL